MTNILRKFIQEVISSERKIEYHTSYYRIIALASGRIDNILLQIRAIPGIVVVTQQEQVRMPDVTHRAIDITVKGFYGSMSSKKFDQFVKKEILEIPKIETVIARSKEDVVTDKSIHKVKNVPKGKEDYEPVLQEPSDVKDLSPQISPGQVNRPKKIAKISKGL
jgi:hypothetical protein